jgi:Domain of unknown function (DUF397)
MPHLPAPDPDQWRKSSRSHDQGACVEIAPVDNLIVVRDSKDPYGPRIAFDREQWRVLAGRIVSGGLDL